MCMSPLTVPAWHAAAFLCSHSARILCTLYFAYRLFCTACAFLIIPHFRSAQNIERSACRTVRYFAIAVDHTPPSCRILWSHFCAIKTSQILSIAVCKNRHMPSWHSWHSNQLAISTMWIFKKYERATSHHTSLLLRIVPHPDTVLYSNGACFVLYVLQLSRSTHYFQYATKIIFLISHFYSQKCLLLSTALLHYFCLLLRPSRSRCNKIFCGKQQPILIYLHQAKSRIIFLSSHHNSLTHFVKNLRYHSKQWHTTHPRYSRNSSLLPYTYHEHNGIHTVCLFCAAAILLPRMSNYFLQKTLSNCLRKSNSLTLQD